MKNLQNKQANNLMEEAYKMISGDPAIDAVSKAAMGDVPQTDKEKRMADFEQKTANYGNQAGENEATNCIDEAYAMLFEALAMLARSHAEEEDSEEQQPAKAQQGCDCCSGDKCDCGDCESC